MQIHQIIREHANTISRQIGRGGRRGKTSGRGHKGQKARAGHVIRPVMRDEMRRLPRWKGRGINKQTPVSPRPAVVNVATLAELFTNGEEVTPTTLAEKGVIEPRGKALPLVKILGDGEISTPVTVSGCRLSGQAREKIEAAGGSVAS